MSDYVMIRKTILSDIADAIRVQKNTTQLYKPSEFASIIRKFLCLPSAESISNINSWKFKSNSFGILPEVKKAVGISIMPPMSFHSKANGVLI